jgi:hypothetical protein
MVTCVPVPSTEHFASAKHICRTLVYLTVDMATTGTAKLVQAMGPCVGGLQSINVWNDDRELTEREQMHLEHLKRKEELCSQNNVPFGPMSMSKYVD